MEIIDRKSNQIGNWLLTRLYVRKNDHGIERLIVGAWEVRRRFEPQSAAKRFFTQPEAFDYIEKQTDKNLRRKI
jgi:hypothetical protein